MVKGRTVGVLRVPKVFGVGRDGGYDDSHGEGGGCECVDVHGVEEPYEKLKAFMCGQP